MDTDRKHWNELQQELRKALSKVETHQTAVELFLGQHARLHAGEVAQAGPVTFEDAVWQGLRDEQVRVIPSNEEHSITWIFWHLTRIEDATMNVLLAGKPQLYTSQGWRERLLSPTGEVGNAMSPAEIASLSAAINLAALRAYRLAVGKQTRENVRALPKGAFKQPVEPERLQQLFDEGAVVEASRGLLDYWGGLTKGGLLLMPPTRHIMVHLNEAMQIKKRLLKESV